MINIPKFLLYGQDNPDIERSIQPSLALRKWGDLSVAEKEVALQELRNNNWLKNYSREILWTIEYLNAAFLRQRPGEQLHQIKPESDRPGFSGNEPEREKAALSDFEHIFLNAPSDALVLRMLSKFAKSYIDSAYYHRAEVAKDTKEKAEYLEKAFDYFDRLANCLNHIFEQFSVNQVLTRSGFVPRQDEKITDEIYTPVLKILADPKWKTVSDSLAGMFEDYREENYSEAITKAHSSIQRFLQILVGEEGKSGKGEVGKLFNKAKQGGIIPVNRFTEPIISVFQRYISSERATNSTAKPALKRAIPSDALLVMNVVMVFLQYCLQEIK